MSFKSMKVAGGTNFSVVLSMDMIIWQMIDHSEGRRYDNANDEPSGDFSRRNVATGFGGMWGWWPAISNKATTTCFVGLCTDGEL
jgi:hypothetical protein